VGQPKGRLLGYAIERCCTSLASMAADTPALFGEVERVALSNPTLASWFALEAPKVSATHTSGFRVSYAAARRKLGEAGGLPFPQVGQLTRPHWTFLDVGRALLLRAALQPLPAAEHPAFVERCFEVGELGEQESLLRTLVLLPDCGALVDSGVSACRHNSLRVFEAIACENPFPALAFPDLSFNQMVIKAVFLEVSVRRIEGLPQRTSSELVRMAAGLASERRAAGREVPEDIQFILESSAP
jgi:hypothetical protein